MPAHVDDQTLSTHHPGLLRLARSLVGSDAEDVVQDAYAAAAGTSGIRSPAAWMRVTVRRIASKRHRSNARRTRREHAASRPEALPATDTVAAALEEQRRVLRLLQGMADPYRRALWLRYFEDQQPRHIAETLGVPVTTVKSQLRRGLEQLRAQLDDAHDGNRSRWMAALTPLVRTNAPAALGLAGVLLLVLAVACVGGAGWWIVDTMSGDSSSQSGSGESMTASASKPGGGLRGRAVVPPEPTPPPGPKLLPDPETPPQVSQLRVNCEFEGTPFQPLRFVVTAADGEVREGKLVKGEAVVMSDLAPGHVHVRCETPAGLTATEVRVQLTPTHSYGVSIKVYPTQTVRGRVVRATDGTPVAGARIEVVVGHEYPMYDDSASAATWRTQSDATGEFTLADVPRGTPLLLLTDAEGFQTTDTWVEAGAKGKATIELHAGGSVEGRVTLSGGGPAANAFVFLAPPVHDEIRAWLGADWRADFAQPVGKTEVVWWLDPQNGEVGPERPPWVLATRTDAQGRYSIDHVELDFRYLVTAYASGLLRAEPAFVTVPTERGRATQDLRLRTSGVLRLRVLGRDGEPAFGLAIHDDKRPLGSTDREGRLVRKGVSVGPRMVFTRRHNEGVWYGTVEIGADTPEKTVQLEVGHSVSGHVYGVDGAPLADVRINVRIDGTREYIRTTSDKTGAFRIDALPAGKAELICWAAQRARFEGPLEITVPASDLTVRAKSVPEPLGDAEIRITVVAPEGSAPPTWVRVGLAMDGPASLSTAFSLLTDDGRWKSNRIDYANSKDLELKDGSVIYKDSFRGKNGLGVWAPGYVPVLVPASAIRDMTVRVELTPARKVSGRLLGPDGRAVAFAKVAPDPAQMGVLAEFATDAEGRFTLSQVPRGALRVVVHADGIPSQVISVPAEVAKAGDITLVGGNRITVLVRDRSGAPFRGTSLLVRASVDGPARQMRYIGDRSRIVLHLPLGTWWIGLEGQDPQRVDLGADDRPTVVVTSTK